MKRKSESFGSSAGEPPTKQRLLDQDMKIHFRSDLFDATVLEKYTNEYARSTPYKHGVIKDLIDPQLLRNVRDEIQSNISFTAKETDIYKIFQSGDLANLDGIDDSSLRLLPSLVTLRDSLYSVPFREYISSIAGSGPLSGSKTDMAVNVYTPGCHLLCHDDVIGSRRVSYILYLTDPDRPWKVSWGGALRLYSTEAYSDKNGMDLKAPSTKFSIAIPPASNQLAFFAVQPGESFHDVEEVYAADANSEDPDNVRVRLAISGWFHMPQAGEKGYQEGVQDALTNKSSLAQLQGQEDGYDLPKAKWRSFGINDLAEDSDIELSEEDLDFLLRYMNPNYLVPDTLEELSALFLEESSLRLASFLTPKFESALRNSVSKADKSKISDLSWKASRPPHKHRFLFQQPNSSYKEAAETPQLLQLLNELFPSQCFRKWLSLATSLSLTECNIIARRFRRGIDYTLATEYNHEEPQLEVCLGLTPTKGWGDDEDAAQIENIDNNDDVKYGDNSSSNNTHKSILNPEPEPAVGGYEVYMAPDDDDGSDHGVTLAQSSHTGAGNRKMADPAIYKTSKVDEDDGVLFSMPACWNTMSIVLRDQGVLKFVKYINRTARGDRWDICGEWKVSADDSEDDV